MQRVRFARVIGAAMVFGLACGSADEHHDPLDAPADAQPEAHEPEAKPQRSVPNGIQLRWLVRSPQIVSALTEADGSDLLALDSMGVSVLAGATGSEILRREFRIDDLSPTEALWDPTTQSLVASADLELNVPSGPIVLRQSLDQGRCGSYREIGGRVQCLAGRVRFKGATTQ